MAYLEYNDQVNDHKELFDLTKSIMGFIPSSMFLMSERPEVLYSFSTLSSSIINQPGKISKFKMLIVFIKQAIAILKSKKQRQEQLPIELK